MKTVIGSDAMAVLVLVPKLRIIKTRMSDMESKERKHDFDGKGRKMIDCETKMNDHGEREMARPACRGFSLRSIRVNFLIVWTSSTHSFLRIFTQSSQRYQHRENHVLIINL